MLSVSGTLPDTHTHTHKVYVLDASMICIKRKVREIEISLPRIQTVESESKIDQ